MQKFPKNQLPGRPKDAKVGLLCFFAMGLLPSVFVCGVCDMCENMAEMHSVWGGESLCVSDQLCESNPSFFPVVSFLPCLSFFLFVLFFSLDPRDTRRFSRTVSKGSQNQHFEDWHVVLDAREFQRRSMKMLEAT